MPIPNLTKDPAEVLDYEMDFAEATNGSSDFPDYLQQGERIVGYTATADSGLTVLSTELVRASTSILFWLSGGSPNKSYRLTVTITTSEGRTVSRFRVVAINRISV